MVAQAILFAAETAAIHEIGAVLSVMQLSFIRAVGGVVLACAIARQSGVVLLHSRQIGLQLTRGMISLLYLWVLMYSFAHMPFADATAISYTQVTYIAVFSVVILGETVTPTRWVAAAFAMCGALLIAKPSFAGFSWVYFVAVAGTSMNALSFVLNRYLQREDSEATTLFYSNLVPLLGNLPALLIDGAPASDSFFWLPAILVCGPVGMLAGIIAVRHADAALLAPYTLLRLVIAIIGGVVVFGEGPDALGALGGAMILASCVLPTDLAVRLLKILSHTFRTQGLSRMAES